MSLCNEEKCDPSPVTFRRDEKKEFAYFHVAVSKDMFSPRKDKVLVYEVTEKKDGEEFKLVAIQSPFDTGGTVAKQQQQLLNPGSVIYPIATQGREKYGWVPEISQSPIQIHNPQNFIPKYLNYKKVHFIILILVCNYSNRCSRSMLSNSSSIQLLTYVQHHAISPCNVDNISKNNFASTDHFLTYVNPVYGIKIDYPSDWNISIARNVKDTWVGPSPEINEYNISITNQNVEIGHSPQVLLKILPKLRDQEQENIYGLGTGIELRKKMYHDFNLTEYSPTTIAGIPAIRMVYSFVDRTGESQNRMELLMTNDTKDKYRYSIEYNSVQPLYCKYLAVALKMMHSLQIDKPGILKMMYCLKLNMTNNDGFSIDNVTQRKYVRCDFSKTLTGLNENERDILAKHGILNNPLSLGNFFYNKGRESEELGNLTEATKYLDKALAIDPTNVNALSEEGKALDSLGNHREAITYFDKALAIVPKEFIALNGKADALSNLGEYTEAIKYYGDGWAADMGNALERSGNHREAITYFDKALAIRPKDTFALNGKADALSNLGEYTEAIKYYDRAVAEYHNLMALASSRVNPGLEKLLLSCPKPWHSFWQFLRSSRRIKQRSKF